MYMLITMSKNAHAISVEDAEKYGNALGAGKSFVVKVPSKHGEAFIQSHQIVEIIPISLWKEQNLISMRDKGQMNCPQCKNVKSIYKPCPHCGDAWDVAKSIKKIDYDEKYFSELYGIETKSLTEGNDKS